jgi:hypothetical protein
MEEWEYNLALESEESSGEVGPNLVLEGESSGGSGPNLIIGVHPVPAGQHRRHYPQPHFPISLVEGWIGRRERPIPHYARIKTIKLRFMWQEAIPPSMYDARVLRRGKGRIVTWSKAFRQHYRVADDSLNRYELYLEEDQLPDFDASTQPVATSTSLPFSYSPDLPESSDTKELWAVVRKRNEFDLLSLNLHPTIIEIDSVGEEELGGMSSPEILRVVDGENGQIIVFARYPYGVDRNEADTWELYATDGIDPDPDVDEILDTESFGAPAADYLWRGVGDGLTSGSTYHVMVVVRRSEESGNGEIGESAVTQFTLAETYDLDEGTTWLFGGQDHEVGT